MFTIEIVQSLLVVNSGPASYRTFQCFGGILRQMGKEGTHHPRWRSAQKDEVQPARPHPRGWPLWPSGGAATAISHAAGTRASVWSGRYAGGLLRPGGQSQSMPTTPSHAQPLFTYAITSCTAALGFSQCTTIGNATHQCLQCRCTFPFRYRAHSATSTAKWQCLPARFQLSTTVLYYQWPYFRSTNSNTYSALLAHPNVIP